MNAFSISTKRNLLVSSKSTAMRSTTGYWRQAKNDLLPLPKRFSHLYGNVPGKRLSPEMQGVPGADPVTEGHGGVVSVFYGVEDGRPNRKEHMR